MTSIAILHELLEVPPVQQAQHKLTSLSRGNRERSSGTRTRMKRLVVIAVMKQVIRTSRTTKTRDQQSGGSYAQQLPTRV